MSVQLSPGVERRVRTVSNRIAADVRVAAEAAGIGPAAFASRTGITAQDLEDLNGRIDGARHGRLIELMSSLPPSIEWLVDARCNLYPHFPVLGNLCFNARTLRQAIDAFMQFRPIVGEFDFLLCKETPDCLHIEYVAEYMPHNCFQALANFQILATLIRAYDTENVGMIRVTLTGAAPANAHILGELFGEAVQYGAQANTLRFSASLLDAPFPHFNALVASSLLQQAQQELKIVQRAHLLSARVEQLISDIVLDSDDEMSDAASTLNKVCARLNTSRWTLNRQLRAEGLHFTELEARVKFARACRLLGETRRSLCEISDLLGFSSQSAFTRFFRSRHPMPPRVFRQYAQQRDGGRVE